MAQKFLTDIEVTRGLVDSSGDLGVAGQVLSSTGSGTNWITNEANSTVVYLDEFTGDNSTVDFTLSVSVTDENITQTYIDGVYQNKDTYSISGTTLTFSTAPPLNADIEVITFSTATTSDDLAAGSVIIPVKNTHTASIAKGEPVYITGNVGSSARLEIAPADASNSAKMPAAGLLLQTLAVNAEGYVITGGYLRNITTDTIDSTSTSSNDTVYVKSGGGLTMTKPTGTNLIQNIAKVARVASGSAGSLLVSSILRTNDIPNITNDYFWLGNSSGVATPTEFTSTARGLLSVGAEGTAAGDGNLAYNNSSGVFTYTPPVLGGLSGTTDNITEGSTNLYYTDARSRSSISSGGDLSYNSTTGVMSYTTPTTIASLSNHDTDDLSEGATNLYYTDTRVGTYLTNNSYATQSYVNTQVSNLVDSAPSTLDTLNELAAALGDDANFSTTVTNSIATKLPLAGGTLTGALSGTSATFSGSISGFGDFTGTNTALNARNGSSGVAIGNYTSAYAYIDLASTNSTFGSWIDFSKGDGQDYGGRIRYHNSNDTFTFTTGGTNDEFVIYTTYTYSPGSSRSPIFYDSDNTGYYLNPHGTSNLSIVQAGSWLFRPMSNQVEYHVLDNGSLNGPSWKFRYDGATANRWVDFGYKDGNGTYYEGLKLYNNSTITWKGNAMWHAGNDGSGSGLDADLLDGQHASAFASSSHTHAASDITSGNLAAARNTVNLANVASTSDASGIYFRSANEVISGEGWCTAQYAYNHNDGFLFLNRNSSSTAFPTFHIGGWNNAGYAGYSDADGMITLTRSDGSKNQGSTYAGTGLSNTSYWTRMVKTTTKTIFKDAQDRHEFNGTVQISAGNSYNENIRMFPGSNDYSSLILGAVAGTSGTGAGQWSLVRFPNANSNKFTIRHNSTDHVTITTSGNVTNHVDTRSPIYYDLSNTAYYAYPTSQSVFYRLKLQGTGTANAATLEIDNPSSSAFIHTGELFTANQTANQSNIFVIGKSGTTKNSGYIGYYWAAAGSNNNFVSIGHWSADHLFRVYGDQVLSTVTLRSDVDMRAPIFYDKDNTSYYVDAATNSVLQQINLYGQLQMQRGQANNAIWFAANTDQNHALWNDYYGGPTTRGAAGSGFDGIKWNAYRGLHIRGGTNGAYNCLVITNTSSNTNTHTVALYAHDDEVLKTTNSSNNGIIVQRDLYLSGSTGGSTGNQLVIGQTSESLTYTHQDTNTRPLIYMTGQYPALTLNHTVTSNANHGPTIQFTHNGNAGRQWVFGSSGDGEHLFIGFSNTSQGNSNYNPHNGIAGYLGTSLMTFHENGRVGIGGDWGGLGSGDPGYAIDTRGTLYNNTDLRAPIFYDALATSYYVDPGSATSINTAGTIRGNYFVGTNYTTDGYTVYKGYDNWNHFISIRGHARPGQSKAQAAILGGHQTSFVEYAENNSTTGWFFIGSAGSTYEEIAKITKDFASFTQVRAPIFYDSNNTNYYTDPASTSVLNALQFNYTQHGSANNIRMGNSTTMNAISSGTNNAAFGVEALGNCTTGSRNFAYGYAALYSVSSGSNNIAMGDAAGYNVSSGGNNLLFGINSGRTGYQSPQSIAGVTTGSNQIHMGNESHTTARIQISWTVNSDARDKTDITPINVGLDFVNELNPVTFRWDKRSDYEDRTPTGENKLEELTLGFLAQEVEEVEKSYGYDISTKTNLVVDRDVEQDHFGITYEKMIPILTKAIQELTQEVQTLKDQINGIN